MNERKVITWEAPEHHHIEKGGDWFWVLGILALSGAVAAFFFRNYLFAILILVGAAAMALHTVKPPRVITFMVATRGVRVGERLYPFGSLESYRLDENGPQGPQLLLKSKQLSSPLIVIPVPEEEMDEVEELVKARLKEEDLEEPLAHRVLELFGF